MGIGQVVKRTERTRSTGEIDSALSQDLELPAAKGIGNRWGWLPVVCTFIAVGAIIVAVGDVDAMYAGPWAETVFWMGLILIFAPVAYRISRRTAPRREVLGLVVLVGLVLYVVKVMRSPTAFAFYDEFIHWRSANDIIRTGHLFSHNPILPVSPLFPGLELVTAALAEMGGLSIFAAGTLVVGAARLLLIVSLFLIFEQVGGSVGIAGLTTLVYIANPNFLFLDAQFSYESLGLPLAFFVLLLIIRRTKPDGRQRATLIVMGFMGIAAGVLTHHVASYGLAAFLVLWATVPGLLRILEKSLGWYADQITGSGYVGELRKAIAMMGRSVLGSAETNIRWASPGVMGVVAVVLCVGWLLYVAWPTVGYLAPTFLGSVKELWGFFVGETMGRELFRSSAGATAPLLEQLTGYGAVLIILVLLPLGLQGIRRRYSSDPLVLSLGLVAIGYPLTLVFRLTNLGADISGRAWAYLFAGVAFVVAIGMDHVLAKWQGSMGAVLGVTAAATVLFAGSVVIGWPPTERLPGPYLVSAQGRSVGAEGESAAWWALKYLGPDNRLTADRMNALLMASYGEQEIVLPPASQIDVGALFFSSVVDEGVLTAVEDASVNYVMVDERLSTGLPVRGTYFDSSEPGAFEHASPIDIAALQKFNSSSLFSRVFDSGDIIIYLVGGNHAR